MALNHLPAQPPAHRLWGATTPGNALLRNVILALAGSALLWLSAKIHVPFYPVPMTMQPGVVLLIGLAYGPWLGLATVLTYLAEGALGLPVFSGTPERGLGLAYMVGPTGGYMLGWLGAVVVMGLAAERTKSWLWLGLAGIVAMAAIYLPGVIWLATFIGFDKAVAAGALPFLLGDLVKIAIVVALGQGGLALLGRYKAG